MTISPASEKDLLFRYLKRYQFNRGHIIMLTEAQLQPKEPPLVHPGYLDCLDQN